MNKNFLIILILLNVFPAFAVKNNCQSEIVGYKLVENSVFPFFIDKKEACFFAFYAVNPEPMTDAHGNGNTGDAIWYGYYQKKKSTKTYIFPKPSDNFWSSVCSIYPSPLKMLEIFSEMN